jgi:hypothetical protein
LANKLNGGDHTSQILQVVELDPMVAEIAKKYFGFSVDEQLKVCSCTISGVE